MIRLEALSLGYEGRPLMERISTEIPSGKLTALVGRNGTGKSTLLRAIAGLGDCLAGSICIGGKPLAALTPRELAEEVAFVATERMRIADLRVKDLVALGRSPYTNWIGRLSEEDRQIIEESLRSVGLAGYEERTLDRLSDGECQRAMIARALAQQTPVILLDEPTSFLDMPNRYELCTLLRRLAHEQGKCILFSTHELDIALSLSDHIALIDTPRLHHLPTPEMVRSGHIERLFSNSTVRFDATSGTVQVLESQK